MDSVLGLLEPLLPLALALVTLAYVLDFRWEAPSRRALAPTLLAATLALLAFRFIAFVVREGRLPLANQAEAFGTIALSITAVFAILAVMNRERALGFPLMAAAALAQLASVLADSTPPPANELLSRPWFGFHAMSAILGYTTFAVSAVYGAVFVYMYRNLKQRRFSAAFERMPSLDVLARSSIRTATMGFVFLTAAILAGALGWVELIQGPVWLDPKVLSNLVAWFVYGTGVFLWYVRGWRGIRAIGLTLIAFTLMVLSSWIVPWALGSAHGVKGLG